MSVKLNETEDGRAMEIQVSGKLTHEDYEQFVPELERLIREHGKIRILFEMSNFHGWEFAALWDDVKFDAKHFSHIERLAMVGDKAWEKGMSAFCRPFTTARIRYFNHTALSEARAWLANRSSGPGAGE